jgi:rhodanese-related sulfurtransferase/DNA-binding transcriptional ArsR family regulator
VSNHRAFKDKIYEQLARVGKAVSSPRRLELLDLLGQAPRTVEELAKEANQTIANTSQHLKVLRGARLVEAEKEGLFVTYRLADPAVADFYRHLRLLAESRLAEIERVVRDYLEGRGPMEAMDRNALLRRVERGEVTVLDVRPLAEYEAGHIPGAVSVPLKELEKLLERLPRDQEIVAYCRGPYCLFAVEAVELLRAHGYRAERLDDSLSDWRARGLPVATGPLPSVER